MWYNLCSNSYIYCMKLNTENLDSVISQSENVVVVDFWAPWCGPCKVMGPIIDELAGEIEGVVFGKVNVDEVPDLARQFNILSIPTFLVFKGGQVVEQFSGSMSKEAFKDKFTKHIG